MVSLPERLIGRWLLPHYNTAQRLICVRIQPEDYVKILKGRGLDPVSEGDQILLCHRWVDNAWFTSPVKSVAAVVNCHPLLR